MAIQGGQGEVVIDTFASIKGYTASAILFDLHLAAICAATGGVRVGIEPGLNRYEFVASQLNGQVITGRPHQIDSERGSGMAIHDELGINRRGWTRVYEQPLQGT